MGQHFANHTIPELTKAVNRLVEGLKPGKLKPILKMKPDIHNIEHIETIALKHGIMGTSDYPQGPEGEVLQSISESQLLYAALSRMYNADNDQHLHEMEKASEMAFDVLSSVSNDFRNEYVDFTWGQ